MDLGEEETGPQVRRLNCVFFKKSNLTGYPTYNKQHLNKNSSKESVKRSEKMPESESIPSKSTGKKRSLEDIVTIDNSKKIKRFLFYKNGMLDYMKIKKNKRLDFFCKHTLRYVPKHNSAPQPITKPQPPTKSIKENENDDFERYNPLRKFNFPY